MATMVDVVCKNTRCKKEFKARSADVKRGWGKFCCKSCKAVEQEKRTHQYANYMDRRLNATGSKHDDEWDEGPGWDAHKDIISFK